MATSNDIIYRRRVQLLELAEELGNMSEAWGLMGISRTRFYEWKQIAEQYGLEALMPKERSRPQQASETPIHVSLICWRSRSSNRPWGTAKPSATGSPLDNLRPWGV